MLVCQECRQPLVATRDRGDAQWICPKCRARVFALAALDRLLEVEVARRLRDGIERGAARAGGECPSCHRTMRAVTLTADAVEVAVDGCRSCGLAQLEAGVFELLPKKARYQESDARQLSRSLAVGRVELDAELQRERRRWSDDLGDLSWPNRILMWLGMPVDADAPPLARAPLVTWSLAALIVLTFLVELMAGPEFMLDLAWIPAEPFRLAGLTVVTSFFVHGGWLHLLGNLYFLLAFGRGVEERIGARRMVLLVGVATVLGNVAHAFFDPRSDVPCVGASGGLSALVLFYAASFPWNRFAIVFWFWLAPKTLIMPAVLWAAFWFAWQLAVAFLQHFGGGSVSAFAHLGGALTGLGAWLAWRRGDRATT